MIELTRLSQDSFLLNSDLIETVESAPDTVIRLTTGNTIRVLESAEEVRMKIIDFRRSITALPTQIGHPQTGARNISRKPA